MTSIERTAYPQFKKLTSARMLHLSFTPNADEITWASERTNTPEALFAVVLALKCHQKLARFPSAGEVPDEVVDHVRRHLDLDEAVEPEHGSGRTAKWHRKQIRARRGVTYDPSRARTIAAEAIREAARSRNYPPDLINVALDRLVEASVELLGFTTLDDMATRIRGEVNAEIFAQVNDRMGEEGQARLQALLSVAEQDTFSMFNRLKKPAQRASWSRFKAQAAYMAEVDELGDTHAWWRASPRPRSPTSPGRPPPRTPTRSRATTPSSAWPWWRAWCTPPACGPATTSHRCCASGSRSSPRRPRTSWRRSATASAR